LQKLNSKVTILQLLNVQAHIGNKTSKWNSFMKSFLFGSRHNIHLFDLKQTSPFLKRTLYFLSSATKNHQVILFVGDHPIVNALVVLLAESTVQSSISRKWICGTLTNWLKMRPYIKFLYTTSIAKIRKKFVLRTEQKIQQKIIQYLKMKFLLSGIEKMPSLPNIVVLFVSELEPLKEAFQLMLPVVTVLSSGPKNYVGATFPIIGNDYLLEALFFYTNLILQAIRSGTMKKRLEFLNTSATQRSSRRSLSREQSVRISLRVYRNYKTIALKRSLRKLLKGNK
jgi:small subunit ribosomal protein S2